MRRAQAWAIAVAGAVFVASLALLVLHIDQPSYGGDELFFAEPLTEWSYKHFSPFKFIYSGPLKLLTGALVFKLIGFSAASVRAISLTAYLLMVLAWCWYLAKERLYVAVAISLLVFGLHGDLVFFAKIDVNQSTFHDLFAVLQLVVFLRLVARPDSRRDQLLFVALSLIGINNHIRHIWLTNGIAFAWLFFHRTSRTLLVSWLSSVAYFGFVLVYFAGAPHLEGARTQGSTIGWPARVWFALGTLGEYLIGGRVLQAAYATPHQSMLLHLGGAFALISTIALIAWMLRQANRVVTALAIITAVVSVQYIVTRSAIYPWHGNYVYLTWALLFGAMVEHGLRVKPWLVGSWALSLLLMMALVRGLTPTHATTPAPDQSGFALALWNLQAVPEIRAHLSAHPGRYVVADWGIGRTFALEAHYDRAPLTDVQLFHDTITDANLRTVSERPIIRSTDLTRTVPDMSDAALHRLGWHFTVEHTFRDSLGRPAYELGYVR